MTETIEPADANEPAARPPSGDDAGAMPVPGGSAPGHDADGETGREAGPDAIDSLSRRMHLLVGTLAVLLAVALGVIGLLFGRVAGAESEAAAARDELAALIADGGVSSSELESIRDDLNRVEAGAALYASQIDGFQAQLAELAPEIEAGVDEAIAGLREFGESTISFEVNVDEVIPIDTEVVIQRTVAVPIVTEIPINEDIDTTITVSTPFGGIPVNVNVPVNVVVPIDLVVDIPIDETVPIRDEFPVQLDIPIAIDVGDTELRNLTDSLAAGLESLRRVLTGLGS